ncbi:MFS transporter [Promethearchaeum syntrophicum]|uniref:MFS transporter n=1 Tax=Promethearchaeum syntrophicum TaxID=2594042 RepID=A0A5B9DAC8_9ARCH|nr:MFS transporter [Candidatus Prometheoarchaeum syntrophicum]
MLQTKGFKLIAGILAGSFSYFINFFLAIQILEEFGLNLVWICVNFVGVVLGAIIFIFFSARKDQNIVFLVSLTTLIGSYIGLHLLTQAWLIFVFLSLTGLSLGHIFPIISGYAKEVYIFPQYLGKWQYLTNLVSFILITIYVLLYLKSNTFGQIIFILFLYSVALLAYFLGHNQMHISKNSTSWRKFLKGVKMKKRYWILLLLAGFQISNLFFAAVLIIDNDPIFSGDEFLTNLGTYIIVLFISSSIFAIFAGMLYDSIGRRWSMGLGVIIMGIGIALMVFFIGNIYVYLYISPAIMGIGFTFLIPGATMIVPIELAPKKNYPIQFGINFIIQGTGMSLGILFDYLLMQVITIGENSIIFLFSQVFVYLLMPYIIFQIPETLPSKEELRWQQSVELLLVISDSGLPLYSKVLRKKKFQADLSLTSGVLNGVMSITEAITSRSTLKTIKQKDYCIMLEKGKYATLAVMTEYELTTLRNQMIEFLKEFEEKYEKVLVAWNGDNNLFSSVYRLVVKYFGLRSIFVHRQAF